MELTGDPARQSASAPDGGRTPLELTGTVVHEGAAKDGGPAEGRLLVLGKPLSLWGGVDPLTGEISDPRHPRQRDALRGRILVMERTIGSRSSSAIMLELLRNDVAPAGIVIAQPDAILVLGILVARELGYPTIPMLRLGEAGIARLAELDGHPATQSGAVLRVRGPG